MVRPMPSGIIFYPCIPCAACLTLSLGWKVLFVWFSISILVLSITGDWGNVVFSLTYGVGYGGFVYVQKNKIRSFFEPLKFGRYGVFITLALLVSVFEEIYVYSLGNKIAVPDLMFDIIIVPCEWAVWFTVWYFFLSRRFYFTEGQALVSAGIGGLLFEYGGNLVFLHNIPGFIVSIPVTIIVYAAIFVLPMQLIRFTGENDRKIKYVVSTVFPYLLTVPVALLLYAVFP